jgi:hypothetical protein
MTTSVDPAFEKLKHVRVMIGTPMISGTCTGQYKNSLVDLLCLFSKWNIAVRLYDVYGESVISKARNKIADEFMNSSFTEEDDRLLLIDSDIAYNAADIIHMILLDKDVVAAPCSLKKINWERVRQASILGFPVWKLPALAGDVIADFITEGGPVEVPVDVGSVGTGVLMIKRKVLTKMQNELTGIKYDLLPQERRTVPDFSGARGANNAFSNSCYAYFQSIINPDPPHNYMTEDWYFCHNWRKLGGKVQLCLWMITRHTGNHEYVMDVPSIVQFGEQLEESKEEERKNEEAEKSSVHA